MDWFETAIHDASELTGVYEPSSALVQQKEIDPHCPEAVELAGEGRDPASSPAKDGQPSPAAMLRDHVGDPALTLEAAEQAMIDAVTIRLA